ncbi:MAG: phosphoribosyl-ATP diphosphatase [Flavobacteriales bacterium]|nr:phosphoribosyl-ATP diphosphatase [Flavobacteriales bacterium]
MEVRENQEYSVVFQDYRTMKVLGLKKVKLEDIHKIKENSYISLESSRTNIDQYIIKEVLKDNLGNVLVKVKVNKDSLHYRLETQFNELNKDSYTYLRRIESQIQKNIRAQKNSKINTIIRKGPPKIAKKFGEEAVELVIEAGKENDELFLGEAADVFFYYILLLHERGYELGEILTTLKAQKRKI